MNPQRWNSSRAVWEDYAPVAVPPIEQRTQLPTVVEGTVVERQKDLRPVDSRGGWYRMVGPVREAYPGAWQQNMVADTTTVLAHHAVWACVTLIASDVAKLRPKLVEQDPEEEPKDRIWSEFESPAFSPVLRKPNHFQNYIQFKENWMLSKLIHGNAYALKQRDQPRRGGGPLPARPVSGGAVRLRRRLDFLSTERR